MFAFINVQCEDDKGKTGDFLTESSGKEDRKPISPTFDSLAEMLPWLYKNGWKLDEYNEEGKFLPWRVKKEET